MIWLRRVPSQLEKTGSISSGNSQEHASVAKAPVNSAWFMPGINPRPAARTNFSPNHSLVRGAIACIALVVSFLCISLAVAQSAPAAAPDQTHVDGAHVDRAHVDRAHIDEIMRGLNRGHGVGQVA